MPAKKCTTKKSTAKKSTAKKSTARKGTERAKSNASAFELGYNAGLRHGRQGH